MKLYTFRRSQTLPISLKEAWEFFSSPANLPKITPSHMGFKILQMDGRKMYAGQFISYRVNVLPFLRTSWVTEITQVSEPHYFVDEQRMGPYSIWHHEHRFEETPQGVLMKDVVHYAIPFGWLGQLAHWLFVKREIRHIFDYRYRVLEQTFSSGSVSNIRKLA